MWSTFLVINFAMFCVKSHSCSSICFAFLWVFAIHIIHVYCSLMLFASLLKTVLSMYDDCYEAMNLIEQKLSSMETVTSDVELLTSFSHDIQVCYKLQSTIYHR